MIGQKLITMATLVVALLGPVQISEGEILAAKTMDLNTRARGERVNQVFKDNILLAVDKFGDGFVLEPGEVFAFHEQVRPEFADQPLKTGFTRYEASEGYQTALGLPGNGVCHLATLMNWAASDAGLEVLAPVNHDFAPIPGAPREYGTSIRYMPASSAGANSANQNLYIKNTLDQPVQFIFETSADELSLQVRELAAGK